MALIHVPRLDAKKAMDLERPVNTLLKKQMEHLHEAERRLPLRHHTNIYINAIKTEGEAADYIRAVTEAIHDAHAAAAERRAGPKRKGEFSIAAVADEQAERKRAGAQAKKKSRRGRKT